MRQPASTRPRAAGFTIIEFLIGISVAIVVMGLASHMIARSFNIRGRENQKSDALSDAQRALNTMSREIANSGFGLNNNGIVAADSDNSSIRVRANLNAYSGQTTSNSVADKDEDVEFKLVDDGTNSYIVRMDVNTNSMTTVLANRIDSFRIHYYNAKVDYTTGDCDIVPPTGVNDVTDKSNAKYLVIIVCVTLPQKGTPGSPGFQPQSKVQLSSDVNLRNAALTNY